MLHYFVEGLGWGLVLAFSMGPIFIMLTQTAIEKGWKAGLSVGAGVWASDLLYIFFCYKFVTSITSTVNNPTVKFWVTLIGGILLFGFGVFLILEKKELKQETVNLNAKNLTGYISKGFIINTINPFTPVFWLTIVTTYVITEGTGTQGTSILFGTIMMVIILSDTCKVILAQYIRKKLTSVHLHYISVISGAVLIIFGLAMLYRIA